MDYSKAERKEGRERTILGRIRERMEWKVGRLIRKGENDGKSDGKDIEGWKIVRLRGKEEGWGGWKGGMDMGDRWKIVRLKEKKEGSEGGKEARTERWIRETDG